MMLVMDPSLAARALAASTEITTAALSGDDPDAVLPLVVSRVAGLAEADLGLVMVRNGEGGLTVEAAHGRSDEDPVGAVLSPRSAAARVARSGVRWWWTTSPPTRGPRRSYPRPCAVTGRSRWPRSAPGNSGSARSRCTGARARSRSLSPLWTW